MVLSKRGWVAKFSSYSAFCSTGSLHFLGGQVCQHRLGVFDSNSQVAFFLLIYVCLLLVLLYWTASEINHVEKKRFEIEIQHNLALSAASVGTWSWDLELDKLSFDAHVQMLFGLQGNSFSSNLAGFLALVHPDDRESVGNVLMSVRDGAQDYHLSYRVNLPDGGLRIVEARGKRYPNYSGRGSRLVGVCFDITERTLPEDRIRDLLVYQETLIDAAGYSVISTDVSGVIKVFNPKASSMLGYSEEEMVDKQTPALIHSGDEVVARAAQFSEELGVSITPGFEVFVAKSNLNLPNTHEWTYVRKDGSTFPVLLTVTALRDHTDTIIGYLGLASDISVLSAAREELKRSNQELEQFAYVASHDLQEPLRMVASFCQILDKKYTHVLDEDGKEYIHFAVDGAKRMQGLVDALLRYARVGKKDVVLSAVDLNQVLSEIQRDLSAVIQENAVVLEIGELPTILANHLQMYQLFQNFVTNGIKFRGEKSPLIRIAAECNNGLWTFAVSDNGIGIDEAYFSKIFVIFQRLHGKDAYPGTGIGLSLCKKIVENFGERLGVTSKSGIGDHFCTHYRQRSYWYEAY